MSLRLICDGTTVTAPFYHQEVLASEIGDADIFTSTPCKSQRVLVTAALGTAIGKDLITAILDNG